MVDCLCHMRTTKAQINLRSLIGAFVVRCLDKTVPLLAIVKVSGPWLVSAAGRAGLGLGWTETPREVFS